MKTNKMKLNPGDEVTVTQRGTSTLIGCTTKRVVAKVDLTNKWLYLEGDLHSWTFYDLNTGKMASIVPGQYDERAIVANTYIEELM